MPSQLRIGFYLLLILAAVNSYAQSPVISYNSPQTYTAGTAIPSLIPISSGVAAQGFSSTKLTVGAGMSAPEGITTDAAGNIYVADNGHRLVKKIPAAGGAIVTLGSGYEGPYAVAVDVAGNVYVADGGNGVKMIPAGGGSQVNIGSGFTSSRGVAVDAAGNLYVADNGLIVKIPAGGGAMVTIGTVSNAFGLAVDAAGNVFAASSLPSIYEIPANGGGAPVSLGSGFNIPTSVAVDAGGNVYVAEYGNNDIKMIPAGGGSAVTVATSLTGAFGVALDGSGNLFVSVSGLNIVKKIKPVGGYFAWPLLPAGLNFNSATGVISGTPTTSSPAANYTVTAYNANGSGSAIVNIKVNANPPPAISISYSSPQTYTAGTAITPLTPTSSGVGAPGYSSSLVGLGSGLSSPKGVAVDATGNVYIADFSNGAVKKIAAGGGTPVTLGTFAQPNGVAVDAAGNVYVSDGGVGIMKIPVGGGSPVTVGSGITDPQSVAVDGAGNIYLSDLGDHTVKEIPVTGGSPIVLGGSGEFLSPYGVAVDAAGNVYVADLEDNNVKKIPAGGGSPVTLGSGFSVPFGVAVDASGNVYVADSGNKLVKKISAGGGITTIASNFLNPYGIATDGAGNIYVSDQLNNTVKEIKPLGGYYALLFLPAGLTIDNSTGIISGTPLNAGPAKDYTITACNAGGNKLATISINVPPSTDASLSDLKVGLLKLTPSFATTTLSYAVTVSNSTTSISVTPTTTNSSSTVTVNGTAVTSGLASGPIALSLGQNTIAVKVTALDGMSAATYTLTVTRSASSNANLSNLTTSNGVLTPAFNTNTTSYTKSVGNAITSMSFTPTTSDPTATVTVNGTAVASGTSSASIALNAGPNVINVVVTAPDGVTQLTYTITVTRAGSSDATLSNLTISAGTLKPAFISTTSNYSVAVGNGVTSVSVTPTTNQPNATVKVNGATVTSGSASGQVALNVGANTITIAVTAQNGVTFKNYKITVNRAVSTNAKLLNLTTSSGVLTPAFNNTITSYTRAVPNSVTSITFTPTSVDNTATITVNGTVVTSGTASAGQPLVVGDNVENIKVTAQDGVTTITYTVTVTRAGGPVNSIYEPVSFISLPDKPLVDDDVVVVHQGLSPNGDGVNDFLQIDGILAYPDNKLQIINRSGQLVFEAKGYDNATAVFDGHSNKTGAKQLPGTYFYTLDYTVNGTGRHKTGFIVLKY